MKVVISHAFQNEYLSIVKGNTRTEGYLKNNEAPSMTLKYYYAKRWVKKSNAKLTTLFERRE